MAAVGRVAEISDEIANAYFHETPSSHFDPNGIGNAFAQTLATKPIAARYTNPKPRSALLFKREILKKIK